MIIAIDVGGTKIAAALMDEYPETPDTLNAPKIITRREIPSVIHQDLPRLSQTLMDLCQDWLPEATAIAVACTGQIGDGVVRFLSAGSDKQLPLKQQLEQASGLPVFLLNDAAAAAWAEYSLRPPAPDRSLVYITLSTGVGGGMIQNGQLVTSSDGFCAHLGHVTTPWAGTDIRCHCGRLNCAEALTSGTAIARQASALLGKELSAKTALTHYANRPEIDALLEQCAGAVVELIATIKAVTGTQTLVLGGSVGLAANFREKIRVRLQQLPAIYQLRLESPLMGTNADLIGVTIYAREQLLALDTTRL